MGQLALANVLTLLVLVAAQVNTSSGAVWTNFWGNLATQLPSADDSFHGPSNLPSAFQFFGTGRQSIYVRIHV